MERRAAALEAFSSPLIRLSHHQGGAQSEQAAWCFGAVCEAMLSHPAESRRRSAFFCAVPMRPKRASRRWTIRSSGQSESAGCGKARSDRKQSFGS